MLLALTVSPVAGAETIKANGTFMLKGAVSEVVGFHIPSLSSSQYHQLTIAGAEVLVLKPSVSVPALGACVLVTGKASSVITNEGQGPLGWFREALTVKELPAKDCR